MEEWKEAINRCVALVARPTSVGSITLDGVLWKMRRVANQIQPKRQNDGHMPFSRAGIVR